MEATKENFYEYITTNSDGVDKYEPMIVNELYQKCISKDSQKTLGVNELYIDDIIQDFNVDKNATDIDVEIAYNELLNLMDKIKLFRDLISEEDIPFDSKPIYKIEDIVNGVKNQKDREYKIDNQVIMKTPDGLLNLQKKLLISGIKALLITLIIETLISQN